jgi:glyoxylase-like metal-dependent hydrolase (beta-lactamase superfamily II)
MEDLMRVPEQRALVATLLLLLAVPLVICADEQDVFEVQRLSDRVLLLTERSPMENIVVTVATAKGLVVFDSTGSPQTAALARKKIEKELGRSDFAYLINTHNHWDHAWGNQVFADAVIVAYEGCQEAIARGATGVQRSADRFSQRRDEVASRLAELDPGSEEAGESRLAIGFYERLSQGLSEGFSATLPQITFNDRMTLDLGDITFRLFYFGSAHSGNDILIQVPEEGLLLTGDVFLDIGWLPLFSGQPKLDIDRWIEVLGIVLDGEDEIKTVIPAHRRVWTRDKLVLWRDYIVELWEGVKAADAEGLSLAEIRERFPLPEECGYLRQLGHDEARLQRFQERNVTAFWRQLKESAALIVERVIEEQGFEAAVQRYQRLSAEPKAAVYFSEDELNSLGYRLLTNNQIKEAIAVFKLNVDAYPDSWNVHDSLGEAYMENGDRDLAIASYSRSIELNPQNQNGIAMLRRLEAQ